MKIKRMLAACLVAVLMMSAMAIPAFAQDDGIEPQSVISCAGCGGTSFYTSTTWGSWNTTGTTNCQHGYSGVDLYQTRRGTRAYKCNNCGRTAFNDSVSESRMFCAPRGVAC